MNDKELPPEFKDMIEQNDWIFAKTYAKKCPHYYFIREWNPELYDEIVRRINAKGRTDFYYNLEGQYYFLDDWKYWCMPPVLNRADRKVTYGNKAIERNKYKEFDNEGSDNNHTE